MTLIPLISTMISAPGATTAPAGASALLPRNSYGAGNSHRPLAALFAVGLPAALVVAVALSPMIIKTTPVTETPPWRPIMLEKPKPPEPKPDAKPREKKAESTVTRTETPFKPVTQDPPLAGPERPYVPLAGAGTGSTVTVEPAPPPKPPLVLAELDKRFLGVFQPDYPMREQHGEIEGIARVRVLIGTDGRVKQVELVSSDSPGFFEQTKRRALAKWRFKPATRGGVPEESWKVMTVRFEIKSA